jgi:hypothetical protein
VRRIRIRGLSYALHASSSRASLRRAPWARIRGAARTAGHFAGRSTARALALEPVPRFVHRSPMPVSAGALFAWHARPGALERLLPPWQHMRIEQPGTIDPGQTVVLRVGLGPFSLRVAARHGPVEQGRSFVDEQESGPFAQWRHVHRFVPKGEHKSVLEDEIEYAFPIRRFLEPLAGRGIHAALERTFRFRHTRTRQDLERHASAPQTSLRVAVTGASGLVGASLTSFLTTGGHSVVRVVRGRPRAEAKGSQSAAASRPSPTADDAVRWDPLRGELDARGLEGLDAVVHLAGESIAALRWTGDKKRAIRDSRVLGTDLLCRALASLDRPPRVLVSASAVGIYGSRGDELLDEDSAPGDDFLADVCRAWEAATAPAAARGIRVVNLRIGVVLAARGGVLGKLRTPFALGLGGRVGNGRQWQSTILLDDLLGAIHLALFDERLRGPVNAVAPVPVLNRELTRALASVLHRPAFAPLPAFAVRAVLGEMGESLLLGSARVVPRRLLDAGFRFFHPDVQSALRFELGRQAVG